MSEVTFEHVLSQVKALPPQGRAKLREYLSAQSEKDQAVEEARERARACATRDLSAEYRWIEEHRDEYAGQWVALKGDQLISSGLRGKEAYDAAVAAGHPDAFMILKDGCETCGWRWLITMRKFISARTTRLDVGSGTDRH